MLRQNSPRPNLICPFSSPLFYSATHRLHFLPTSRSRRNILIKMGVEKTRMGLVRPASADYAGEAIEAVKAGKVIAVPTDTLYGFACGACAKEETVAMLERYSLIEENGTS